MVRMAAAAGAAWVWGFLSGKVPTALDLMKGMLEQEGDPCRWYNLWCHDCSVSPKERTGIEMKMLTEVLWFGGC